MNAELPAFDSGEDPERYPAVVFIMGPTAGGKTDLAVELARKLPCELISVDSTQVYRGLDIGSAKPSAELLTQFPHRLIDICDPSEAYSAARFRADALQEVSRAASAGRIPVLVGGTMLYFRAFEQGLSSLPEADQGVRTTLSRELETRGLDALYERLGRIDPRAAQRIHPNDPQRILRALEVFEVSGVPISELQATASARRYPGRVVKLARGPRDRSVLHDRIAARFRSMLGLGFVEEVRQLLRRPGLHPGLPSLRSVGYRQVAGFLLGLYGEKEMVEKGIVATRQLAKRQLTWIRADPEIRWIFDDSGPTLEQALKRLRDARISSD